MDHEYSIALCYLLQGGNLLAHRDFERLGRHLHRRAPEVFAVRISGMRAHAHAELPGKTDGDFHRLFIAGVSAASDIRRCELAHDFFFRTVGDRFAAIPQYRN